MSGTNTILRRPEDVREDMGRLIEELVPEGVCRVEGVDLCVLKYGEAFLDILRKRCTVGGHALYGEGETALAAAGAAYGIVAQAGTGSDAFLVQPGGQMSIGGWGYIFGDEGSGYDIGERTLRAAIHAFDGRGPKTLILDILKERWGLGELWDIVGMAMGGGDYRHLVASASYITSEAARLDDAVALGIYETAAREMAAQVFAVAARNGGAWQGPIVASGGGGRDIPGCSRLSVGKSVSGTRMRGLSIRCSSRWWDVWFCADLRTEKRSKASQTACGGSLPLFATAQRDSQDSGLWTALPDSAPSEIEKGKR